MWSNNTNTRKVKVGSKIKDKKTNDCFIIFDVLDNSFRRQIVDGYCPDDYIIQNSCGMKKEIKGIEMDHDYEILEI